MSNLFCTVVIPCRDGEKTLPQTLDSLLAQTVPIQILVSNDASIDDTQMILKEYAKQGVISINYPTREPRNYARVPILLNMLKPIEPDTPYYMVSGDDTVFPPDYIKRVTENMEQHGASVASGVSIQDKHRTTKATPGGSGRVFTKEAWANLTPFYPNIAWESGALYKARSFGYTLGFYDVEKSHITPQTAGSTWTFGHANYLLGTPLSYTVLRVLNTIKNHDHPTWNAICILLGQIEYEYKRPERVDIWRYNQKKKYYQRNIAILRMLTW
ncbi:glycosyltransferase family 2 protein, partial [Candidatus Bathyarchaeota archaeon]|nr:glycosyltransferase family 2 protein [Candidatus Bathyarchaeota archaeon]